MAPISAFVESLSDPCGFREFGILWCNMATFHADVQTPTSGGPDGSPDSTSTPISTHSTGLKNIDTPDFLALSRFQPFLNPNGGGVYQSLLSTGADSLKLDSNHDITITGSFRTETGKAFTRTIGSGVGAGHPFDGVTTSTDEVDGFTTNLFKSSVTEVFKVEQTDTQPNLLNYTLNGLDILQSSPHIVRVTGTNTQVRAGTTHEDIELSTQTTSVYSGSSYGEQYRGTHFKFFEGGVTADIFGWMRSEFVEFVQINIVIGFGLVVHAFLKVMQLMGATTRFMKFEWEGLKNTMKGLETKLVGFRARNHAFSMRGGFVLRGIWRAFF
jgi:hypothetical protein